MADTTSVAIDVALLLPDTLASSLTGLNRTLEPPPDGFHFDATHLPHLTLVQQFVRDRDLTEITRVVGAVLQDQAPLAVATTQVSRQRVSTTLGVTGTDELLALHRRLMDRLEPFRTHGGGAEAFWTDGDVPRTADVCWAAMFREQAAFTRFDPHITVGVGDLDGEVVATPFVATQVALCHLGRFCTCRRVLTAWPLTAQRR